jgi:hypothetical protein
MRKAPEDLTGKVFARLTVVRRMLNSKSGSTRWLCMCQCGQQKVIVRYQLTRQQSCGCFQVERSKAIAKIMGDANALHLHAVNRTREYQSWLHMRQRCNNPKNHAYADYGGRGIKICEEWLADFRNFLADMGNRPINTTLDRINVNGNYEPDNCRWASPKIQVHNRRGSYGRKTIPD